MMIQKAILKKTGITVYIRDTKPNMPYNSHMLVVSKQPEGMNIFCVAKNELEIINESNKI